MPPGKDLCRNFRRGSCQYGDRCKFLHATQQEAKPNPFGFGVQNSSNFPSTTSQQPNTNPFGFGAQNQQPNGVANFGTSGQSNNFKPFQNKWTRTPSATGGSSTASQQNPNQSQAANHRCTDPDSCKKLMAADFEQEQPLWKLTCYGHFKHLPCDVTGDTSYEELRAAAYEDAKRGMSLQLIVERERNLQNSKLLEFQSLLSNPTTKQSNPGQSLPNPFTSAGQNSFSPAAQNQSPSPFPTFGQPGTSFGTGASMSSSNPSSNPFGQIQNSSQTPATFGFGSTASAPAGGQVSMSSGGGPFGAFASKTPSFNSSGASNQSNPMPSFASFAPQHSTNNANNQQPTLFNTSGSHSIGSGQTTTNSQLLDNMPKSSFTGNASIWLKDDWKLGEIPEEVPPAEYIR